MAQGVQGDLADIRYYSDITPIFYTESNKPLADLNANILVNDQKLSDIRSGEVDISQSGDGTFVIPVIFIGNVSATPNVLVSLKDADAVLGKVFVASKNHTVGGFDLVVVSSGTGGVWTGAVIWLADGRA